MPGPLNFVEGMLGGGYYTVGRLGIESVTRASGSDPVAKVALV